MADLRPDQIRVDAPGGGVNGQTLHYARPFVGITVEEAIKRLKGGGKAGLPLNIGMPYQLNGEEVKPDSDRVFKQGDVLTVDP